ncbi:GNAT family N-acetyltransferase [Kitasatospora sp. NBC_01287]|uniref:GNAT family N-acetyltransferase n=1 Tax=Kitasatospora sp. NBC_01287 TaxID=2903573 RepID=UPI002255795B|nr:GNAT family N-acetyltransferase [Kitasatospora sp. NBC_01287]MCX4748353.1 GNAT family N-acetyltransferase [Kitasatospora sp. NBC_01287]
MITTERLRLRPLTTADTDWWVELHADPEVGRFLGGYTREQAAARLAGIEEQWQQRGHGLCAIELATTGEPIGRSGLFWWEQFDETEAGWTLARPHWGHGYAVEAARAVLAWGFGELGLTRITAMIHLGNDASTAVAHRLGFTPLRTDTLAGRPITVHALDRPTSAARYDRS